MELFRILDRPVWEAEALNLVGWFTARLSDYDAARAHCEAALSLHRHHRNADGEATALGNLGYVAHHTEQYIHALGNYQQSLKILREVGDNYNVALALDWIGQTHATLGEHAQADLAWREALHLYEDQGRATDAERLRQQLDTLNQPRA